MFSLAQPRRPADLMTSPQASYRLNRAAWIPVPVLALLIAALWVADMGTPHASPSLLIGFNLLFLTLLSLGSAYFLARSFLISAQPGLLLLACGVLFWGASGFTRPLLTLTIDNATRLDPHMALTLHNICTWLSALCQLAGAAWLTRWPGLGLRAPHLWLAAACAAVLGTVGLSLVAAFSGLTQSFFTAQGATTTLRQLVLGSTIAMLLLTAALLHEASRSRKSAFVAWYALALQLWALGLLGMLLAPAMDSVLSWLSRATLYLGGGYLLVAALASTSRSGRHPSFTLEAGRHHPLHTYGVAAAIVIVAAIIRLVFMQGLGTSVAFLTFYPAVMLASLYAGLRAGLLATALSSALAHYLWLEPGLSRVEVEGADLMALAVFVVSGVMTAWIVESMHRALAKREEAQAEQKRLNRALRLLNDCNLAVVRATSEPDLLAELCHLLVQSGGYLLAWVGMAQHDAVKSVRVAAQSGYEHGYLEGIRISWDSEQVIGRGPMGMALRTGSTQINQDHRSNPLMGPWHEAYLKHGYRSSLALPLTRQGLMFGALALYSAVPQAFGAEEIQLLEELAGNVAYGMQSLRAREQLERYKRHLEELVTERTQEIGALHSELLAKVRDAESANRAKGEFLANMSHELRTPLNAVVGLTGLLADSSLNRRERNYAANIQLSAQALRALIDDVLDFSRIEAGAVQLEQAPFSLSALLRTTAAVLGGSLAHKPIEALFEVAPGVPDALIGDALRLQQILLNLTGNAVKFTEAGEIVVSVRLLAAQASQVVLQFAVRDTGIGISGEQLGRVFEMFSQADSSTNRRYGGSGLGLAISARLAELMGGQISVESALGRGSEFHVNLTLAREMNAPLSGLHESRPDLRILIIDDHPLARDVLTRTCAGFGWHATALDSGAAALEELRRSAAEGRDYDLMLLDWRMPEMDGIEMLRQAYATPGIGLPMVVLMASIVELTQAVAASDDLHLDGIASKPMTPACLLEAVTQAYAGEFATLPPPGQKDSRLAGMRLLVAEDNELNQHVIEQMLTRAGAEVVLAYDGRAAVNALKVPGVRFDAVLMDLQMPIMDGYAATRVIREEMGLLDLPIIAVTAHARPEDHHKSRAAGMAGHVSKPIDVDDLLDILAGKTRNTPAQAVPAAQARRDQAGALPGLEVEVALPMFGGDRAVYGKLLRKFAAQHSGDAETARRLFNTDDSPGAMRLLHDLGGVCGFLRAMEVARHALATERALSSGNVHGVPALFDELQTAMGVLGDSIRQFDDIQAAT